MTTFAAERPADTEYAPYYHGYIARVPAGDVVATLETQIDATLAFLRAIPEERTLARYAPGKWSIKEVVGHLADAERVFVYRALRFARADATPLPGFDENEFVRHARTDARPWTDIVADLEALRRSTVAFFRSLDDEGWRGRGVANGKEQTVRAIAYVLAGHEAHHVEIIRTRYLGG